MIPTLETERLILRAFVPADFERFAEIWTEPEVVRFIGGVPRSRAVSRTAFLRNAGAWQIEGLGNWAVTERAGGRLIGQVGYFNALRGLGPDFDAAPECGWVLSRDAQGRGYAAEVIAAAHCWFDEQSFGGTSHVMIETGHAASLSVARRAGYLDFRETEYEGNRVLILRRQRR